MGVRSKQLAGPCEAFTKSKEQRSHVFSVGIADDVQEVGLYFLEDFDPLCVGHFSQTSLKLPGVVLVPALLE